jgi:transcriptional regulator with XRE-family HTH domain
MSEIAKASGLTREALYKALRADAQPRFDTISRVCAALGVRLVRNPCIPDPNASPVDNLPELSLIAGRQSPTFF